MNQETKTKVIENICLNKAIEEISKMSEEERNNYKNSIKKTSSFWDKEINNKKDILKIINKIKNDSIDNYERFKSWNFLEYLSLKSGLKEGFFATNKNRIERITNEAFFNQELNKEQVFNMMCFNEMSMMTNFFNYDGKLFKINQELFNLLINTNVNIKYENIPFNQIFLQTNELVIENVEIFGVLLRNRIVDNLKQPFNEFLKTRESNNHGALEILIIGIDLNDGENVWFNETIFQDNKDLNESRNNKYSEKYSEKYKNNWCSKETDKKIRSELIKVTINLINLINHPEVEIINHSKKELRENRIKKGRLGIPDSVEINLTGKLKKYVYEDLPNQIESANNYSNKFWVRGHWMNFNSKRYINMIGKKTWILPYIKGRGELISKDYYLGEKEKQWKHENKMKKIIQSIYPDKEIKNNNRTELNGLEIDCYIPELKLGFEYNGEQHYNHIKIFHKTTEDFEAQKERDIKKNELAKEKGIRLITIRYNEQLTEKLILNKINGDINER